MSFRVSVTVNCALARHPYGTVIYFTYMHNTWTYVANICHICSHICRRSQYVWSHICTYVQNVDIYAEVMPAYMSRPSYMSEICGYIYENCKLMCRPIFYGDVNEAIARQGQDRGPKAEAYSHEAKTSYQKAIERPRTVKIYLDEGFMVQSLLVEAKAGTRPGEALILSTSYRFMCLLGGHVR